MITAKRSQSSPLSIRISIYINVARIHSRAPKTSTTWITRGTQGYLNNNRKGKSNAMIERELIPILEKCAPRSNKLKMTGRSFNKFMDK
ncbi:MAG: hypothetical protein IIB05_04155 [Bacteroidetes bacterium]|nr:hypothetical protein [Bacteroidota bacterium]